MSKAKTETKMDSFQSWAHRWGRVGTLIALIYMVALPFVVLAAYDSIPSLGEVFNVNTFSILLIYIPVGFSEALSYTPILGCSAYLAFITGNIMNLKLPVAANAMNLTKKQPNTPEGEAIASVAVAVSSLMTVAILTLAAVCASFISPVFELPAVKTASGYLLPALFGSMALGLFASSASGNKVVKGGIKGVLPVLIIMTVLSLAARLAGYGAVLGGLVTLMGLFLLYRLTGTLVMAQLPDACARVTDRGQLWAAALCILFGFAAKAGVFPLHIWLPKAHPVAPAPASALLSGVLTKAGIFGALIITADLLPGEHRWGLLLLALGAVTMVLGAAIAVFSNNLKYILACSSLSQIGFILVGTAALSLLGQHNALAAHGTVLYMMNHSLVKLTLFLLAGVVYCNTHALDLNQIRGFGRGKPLLHILFLCGACSLAGIPGFLGYISKTLVHESLVELAAESGSLGVTAVEWLFLFSGGLTAAYLTKIYAALFWQKPAASTGRTWGTPATTAALILAALPLPVLGLLPHVLAEPAAALALPFVGGHPFGHAVHYLAWENLKGVAISLTTGMAVYFLFIRLVLMDRKGAEAVYLERWPRWLSLEERVYRPVIRGLYRVLNVVMRAVCDALDFLVLVARRTFLRDSRPRRHKSPRSAMIHAMTHGGQRTEQEAADRLGTILDTLRRMEGSLSYALLMACLGLCIVLVCILLYVF